MDMPEKYKKIIPAAIAVILAIAGIMAYNKIQDDKKNARPPIITEKRPDLTEDERRIVDDRLKQVLEKIEKPPEGATSIEKYSWNMQAGFQKMALGKYSEAKEYFVAASAIQPADYTAWVAMYEATLAMNDYETARENIKKAISLDSSNPDLWRKYIQLEKEKFKAPDSQLDQLFSEALASTGSDVNIITIYAQFLEEKGDLKGAIEQWKKAIAANAGNKELYQAEITRLEGLMKWRLG